MTEQALVQAICDNLDDDGPRLVYADWLVEQGDDDLASFVRMQCELSSVEPTHADWPELCFQMEQAKNVSIPRLRKRLNQFFRIPDDLDVGFERGMPKSVQFRKLNDLESFGPNDVLAGTIRHLDLTRVSRQRESGWSEGIRDYCRSFDRGSPWEHTGANTTRIRLDHLVAAHDVLVYGQNGWGHFKELAGTSANRATPLPVHFSAPTYVCE